MSQLYLFSGEPDKWEDHYSKEMPEYNNINVPEPEITALFKFRNENDYIKFKELVQKYVYNGEKVFDGMQRKNEKNAWYPHQEKGSKYYYISKNNNHPRFPVYIVSKGRYKRRPTANALERMGVDYKIIVEKHEYEKYCNAVGKEKVLILPQKYLDNYDTFWPREADNKTGPGPARNFAWEHSIESGHLWHWVLDDNIESFERFNNNLQSPCLDGTPFYVVENFVLRYENIAQAGIGYKIFCPVTERRPAIRFNTRIYSILLIRNDIPFRWRGRYNEDTDLSLRALKAGWCTVEFNSFLAGKRATQTMKGGNTDEFYIKEGTKRKSQILVDMHPDVTRLTYKFNRWHHHVDYRRFKANKLKMKKSIKLQNKVNNYGMIRLKAKDEKDFKESAKFDGY